MNRYRVIRTLLAAVLLSVLAACADSVAKSPAAPQSSAAADPHTVSYDGVAGITFGETSANLVSSGRLQPESEGCARQLVGTAELSPVFDAGRLVLLWVYPPYETPEGIHVGSTVADARRAYPVATALTPPAGSYVFPGLMVTSGDRAYLFLHDGQTVQKAVVGFTEFARRLYTDGYGTC